jgi:hypothetical protein
MVHRLSPMWLLAKAGELLRPHPVRPQLLTLSIALHFAENHTIKKDLFARLRIRKLND